MVIDGAGVPERLPNIIAERLECAPILVGRVELRERGVDVRQRVLGSSGSESCFRQPIAAPRLLLGENGL